MKMQLTVNLLPFRQDPLGTRENKTAKLKKFDWLLDALGEWMAMNTLCGDYARNWAILFHLRKTFQFIQQLTKKEGEPNILENGQSVR